MAKKSVEDADRFAALYARHLRLQNGVTDAILGLEAEIKATQDDRKACAALMAIQDKLIVAHEASK